jgi:hypothetical protein
MYIAPPSSKNDDRKKRMSPEPAVAVYMKVRGEKLNSYPALEWEKTEPRGDGGWIVDKDSSRSPVPCLSLVPSRF